VTKPLLVAIAQLGKRHGCFVCGPGGDRPGYLFDMAASIERRSGSSFECSSRKTCTAPGPLAAPLMSRYGSHWSSGHGAPITPGIQILARIRAVAASASADDQALFEAIIAMDSGGRRAADTSCRRARAPCYSSMAAMRDR
jgi:hypothetical protein